jgi:hypothetical protein
MRPADDAEFNFPQTETEDLTNMRTMRTNRLGLVFILAIIAAFVAVPTSVSFAQDAIDDPSSSQYDAPIPTPTPTDEPTGETAGESASGAETDQGGLDAPLGSLPFTGMDLLILLAVAGLLVGTGFALRKLSSPRGPGV